MLSPSFLWAGGSVGAAGRFYWPSLLASRRSLRPPRPSLPPRGALRTADAGRDLVREPLPRQPGGLDWIGPFGCDQINQTLKGAGGRAWGRQGLSAQSAIPS